MITQYKEANLVLWVIYSLSHTAEESRESDFINTLPGIKNKKKGSFIYFYGTQLKEDVTTAALV